MNKKPVNNKTIITIIILCLIAVVIVALFPRRYGIKDGGSVRFESVCLGGIYVIEKRHMLILEGGKTYYEIGTVISIFGVEVYNDASIDYSNPIDNPSSEEEVEHIKEAVASIMSKNT